MISVIVPVYNGEKTLQRCIDSIIESTVKDIEIILVENGSTDQTLKICQAYSNQYENIKTIVADVKGLSHARNLGMNAAKAIGLHSLMLMTISALSCMNVACKR